LRMRADAAAPLGSFAVGRPLADDRGGCAGLRLAVRCRTAIRWRARGCRCVPPGVAGCQRLPVWSGWCRLLSAHPRQAGRRPQQIPDRPAGYGPCRIVPDGPGRCRAVPPSVASCRNVLAGDDTARPVRGARRPDLMTPCGSGRDSLARSDMSRPGTTRGTRRHHLARSGTARHDPGRIGLKRTVWNPWISAANAGSIDVRRVIAVSLLVAG
jgi:hypothetical protein